MLTLRSNPSSKARSRTFIPGMPNSCITSQTSRVMVPRSSAITGKQGNFRASVPRSPAVGAGTHRPSVAVVAPAGTSQYATRPRKWSIRT